MIDDRLPQLFASLQHFIISFLQVHSCSPLRPPIVGLGEAERTELSEGTHCVSSLPSFTRKIWLEDNKMATLYHEQSLGGSGSENSEGIAFRVL